MKNPTHTTDCFWFKIVLTVAGILFLAGCAFSKPTVSSRPLPVAVANGDFPLSVAVLPFMNFTDTEGIAEMVRVNFYSHVSALPYRDIELDAVDARLRQFGLADREAIAKTPVKKLGRLLGCDAVIFGSVFEFGRMFAGLYSTMSVGASIHVWDTRTGRKIWSERHIARDHEGGVPLTLLDIPMITLRTGFNLRNATKIKAVDELTRELAANLPRPRSITIGYGDSSKRKYELQAGAFFESDRANQFKDTLKRNGYPAFVRRNNDDRGVWHRVIVGPYRNREKALQVQMRIRETLGAECLLSLKNS